MRMFRKKEEAPPPPPPPPPAPPAPPSFTVVVVDDTEDIRSLMRMALERAGFDVVAVAEKARRVPECPDPARRPGRDDVARLEGDGR